VGVVGGIVRVRCRCGVRRFRAWCAAVSPGNFFLWHCGGGRRARGAPHTTNKEVARERASTSRPPERPRELCNLHGPPFAQWLLAATMSAHAPLTLYHVNPKHEGPMPIDMDTADVYGDMFFDLRSKVLPIECTNSSSSGHGSRGDCSNGE
jgi:hypothetical protein